MEASSKTMEPERKGEIFRGSRKSAHNQAEEREKAEKKYIR